MNYVTWDELLHFCELLVAIATFVSVVYYNHKKK